MPKGLLEVTGTIDLTQFWPAGESDADTVKVVVGENSFRFTPHPGAASKVTHAFDDATVRGKVSKPAIDKNQRVTIRLQGIDAPELHYRPTAPTLNKKPPTATQKANFGKNNANFRQLLGESATVALDGFLNGVGSSPLKCLVRTAVDEPNDVFDMFGRMIGDIIVNVGSKEVNANHWLCEHGWAFPTFYSSMTNEEINELIALTKAARKAKRGVWAKPTSKLSAIDRALIFRKGGPAAPAADKGSAIMPKLFRRRSTFDVARAAKMTAASFKNYLAAEPDACFETADFLMNGLTAATPKHLDDFVSADSTFTAGAEDLVFQEGKSRVVGKNGQPVVW